MLSNSVPGNARPVRQGAASGEPAVGSASVPTVRPQQAVQQFIQTQNSGPGLQSVKQEMARSFPGFFKKEARGKRRFAPFNRTVPGKTFLINFFLLEKIHEKTPKGQEEIPLMLAGLGKRSLSVSENMTHSEFSDLLLSAYQRLSNISGGWMLHKSTGGGGQRSLVVIPPDLDGYTGQQLKAVSGKGKYTLYICPLQEELNTIPLPPEAKEFENMPKAQCTTCKKMVPLQILPTHIKECKTELVDLSSSDEEESCIEEHEFSDHIGKTAECPVCNDSFEVDLIEIHAATCGLRPSEKDGQGSSGSVPVSQIGTFQSTAEILDWFALQVNETNTFSICVSRTDLFNRGMQQWQRQKKTSPECRLKVTFFGEAGIDTGALSREFLTEMLAVIESRLFVGGSDKKGKNSIYCLSSLDSNYFRYAGEIMAASLAQGGPCPNFLREWCFRYLCSGDSDSIQVSASDVTDSDLSALIERINSASDDISDLLDDIVTCGYNGVVSMENRDRIVRTIILHSTMRVLPMLDQLRKGLQLYDLPKVMKNHQDLCQTLFVPGEDDEVDAAFLMESIRPVYSDISSAQHQKEVNIMNFLQDFLQEIEDSEHEGTSNDGLTANSLTVGRVMQWLTGQRHKPVLPTHLTTYSEFKNNFTMTICFGQTFDRV